jgi:hypothetical protein
MSADFCTYEMSKSIQTSNFFPHSLGISHISIVSVGSCELYDEALQVLD